MAAQLKVIVEQGDTRCGCACAYYNVDCGTEEKDSSAGRQQNLRMVGEFVQVLKDRYEDRLNISVVNPRSIRAIWDDIRYGVRPSVPVWVLDGKKIFEGVPDLKSLQGAIDANQRET
jgi:hypothetical protein